MNSEGESEFADTQIDRLAETLADIDAAIVEGGKPSTHAEAATDNDFHSRLNRGTSFLWLLEQAWPRRTDETTHGEASTLPFHHQDEGDDRAEDLIFQDGPTRFGRFEIMRTLGRGGFGIVFLAWDPDLRRNVALKVPQPVVLASAGARKRFLREGRAAGGLDHPNIIPVHETGTVGSVHYIASTYCEGPTLGEWLGSNRDEPVPLHDAARLVLALARGVQHAHERGVLHRDLKPSNVLLQRKVSGAQGSPWANAPLSDFTPRLTDFSLARIIDDEGTHTLSGIPFGSPSYMAPEQAEGKPTEMGPATDVYGLGCILHVLLVGHPPFAGQSQVEILRRVVADEPIAPRKSRRDVPRSLEAVVLHCLEKMPAKRYTSAADLADDLQRFLAGEPVLVRPVGLGARAVRLARRHRLMLSVATIVVLLSTVLISSLAWNRHRLSLANSVAERQTEASQKLKRTASRLAYVADIHAASTAIDEGASSLARAILEKHRPTTPGQHDQRDFAWYHLQERCRGNELMTLTGHSGEAYHVEFSPDGSRLASCGKDGTVRIRDASTGQPIRTFHADQTEVNWVSYSPDGTTLATTGDDGLHQAMGREVGRKSGDPEGACRRMLDRPVHTRWKVPAILRPKRWRGEALGSWVEA